MADMVSVSFESSEPRRGCRRPGPGAGAAGPGGPSARELAPRRSESGGRAGHAGPDAELTALRPGRQRGAEAAFYSELEPYGVPFDVIGLSSYSILGDGPISDMRAGTAGR